MEVIRPGRWVVTRNEATGRTSARQVLGSTERPSPELVTVELARTSEGPVVETGTPEYSFSVADRGFVALGALGIGTEGVTRAGPPLVVVSRRWVAEPRGVAVFNLEVVEDHTYFVGVTPGRAWVHNTCWRFHTAAPDWAVEGWPHHRGRSRTRCSAGISGRHSLPSGV